MPKNAAEKLHREALILLGIDIAQWNLLTPAERKKRYRPIILQALLENHPDRRRGLVEGSPQHQNYLDTTKQLTSLLNFDEPIGSFDEETVYAESAGAAASSDHATSVSEARDAAPRRPVAFPKTYSELLYDLKMYSNNGLNRNNWYYDAIKECIPNLAPYESWAELQRYCADDFAFVTMAMEIKLTLNRYRGIEDFVSALVSRDHLRIKIAFDTMVVHLKYPKSKDIFVNFRQVLFNFFIPTDAMLKEFVDYFCLYHVCRGAHFKMVTLLCESLSLKLPFEITDVKTLVDPELVRKLLMTYVKGDPGTPLLHDSQSDAELASLRRI